MHVSLKSCSSGRSDPISQKCKARLSATSISWPLLEYRLAYRTAYSGSPLLHSFGLFTRSIPSGMVGRFHEEVVLACLPVDVRLHHPAFAAGVNRAVLYRLPGTDDVPIFQLTVSGV
jgi:hypothetical protein